MNITSQHLSSFLILAFVMSVTPGPNNLMVLNSSVRFGPRNTLGHISGASVGSALMLLAVGFGLHELFVSLPYMQEAMRYCGSAYILYLSSRILRDSGKRQSLALQQPMGFASAAVFQWVNPKSWIMASVAISTCLPVVFSLGDVVLYTILFAAISFPCVGIWAWFGGFIKSYLKNQIVMRCFNVGCAGLLAASALLIAL